jgi:GNAT superfamily N-acetyltransferase
MKKKVKVILGKDPNPKDFETIASGLRAHHKECGHVRDEKKFSMILKDDKGDTVGGIITTCFWGRMRIDQIWVEKSLRKQGWGRKMLEKAEKQAIKLGCHAAHTDTFEWQAIQFYKKCGYEVFAKLDDYPIGYKLYYFSKKL